MRHRRRRARVLRTLLTAAAVATAALPGYLLAGHADAQEPADARTIAEQALAAEGVVLGVSLDLGRDCMTERGFDVHPDTVVDDDDAVAPDLDEAARYGFSSADEDARNASAFTAKPVAYRRAYYTAFAGDADWHVDSGVPPAPGSCLAAVNMRVFGAIAAPYRPSAFDPVVLSQELGTDPALEAAYGRWRACVSAKGDYPDFATPEDAEEWADARYDAAPYEDARATEHALAVDVATCAGGSGLREAYATARVRAEDRLYAGQRTDIAIWRDALALALARCPAVFVG